MLKWITVDPVYLDYMRTNIDPHIPRTDYGANRLKPFFGVLFETESYAYVAQVSHPQPKHQGMKASMTFVKVFDQNNLLCVVNLNYMFPIPKTHVIEMKYRDIEQYRTFSSTIEKNNYVALLKKEMGIMRTMNIGQAAYKLYEICLSYPESPVAKICMNYSALEAGCSAYYPNKI